MSTYRRKRVMISQPMSGIPDEDVDHTRKKAEDYLKSKGFNLIPHWNTDFFIPPLLWNACCKRVVCKGIYYLAADMIAMSLADTVYFCDGWTESKGCKAEHAIASLYGLEIIYESPKEDKNNGTEKESNAESADEREE